MNMARSTARSFITYEPINKLYSLAAVGAAGEPMGLPRHVRVYTQTNDAKCSRVAHHVLACLLHDQFGW